MPAESIATCSEQESQGTRRDTRLGDVDHAPANEGNRGVQNTKDSSSTEVIDLFLCHNGADKEWVRRLAEQIESETFEGTPDGRRLRVFFDEWDIAPGGNVVKRLNDGLARARYVAVVISPDMVTADWPTFEWTHVVADDPTNRRGRLLPLFARDGTERGGKRIDLPAPFRVLSWIDFRHAPSFKSSFIKLVRQLRDLAPSRGKRLAPIAALARGQLPAIVPKDAASPDRVSEVILGNLIPALSLPMTVWSAPTACREEKDVLALIWPKPTEAGLFQAETGAGLDVPERLPRPPGFALGDKRLFTFADLGKSDNRFKKAIELDGVSSHAAHSWRSDPVRWNMYVQLLNKCLKQHCYSLGLRRELRGRYFFLPARDGGKRRHGRRTVAAPKHNEITNQTFWVHHGAWLQFQTLGDRLFLLIEPSYVFTSDGRESLRGKIVGPLSMQWTGKEKNAAILRHVRFWSGVLAGDRVEIVIPTGAASIRLSGLPATAQTSFGLESDHIAIGSLLEALDDELGKVAASVSFDELDGANEDDDEDTPESL